MATDKTGQQNKRPVVTAEAVEQAREIVAKEFSQQLANSLSDGDALTLAMSIVSKGS